jgi:hypothetical protein
MRMVESLECSLEEIISGYVSTFSHGCCDEKLRNRVSPATRVPRFLNVPAKYSALHNYRHVKCRGYSATLYRAHLFFTSIISNMKFYKIFLSDCKRHHLLVMCIVFMWTHYIARCIWYIPLLSLNYKTCGAFAWIFMKKNYEIILFHGICTDVRGTCIIINETLIMKCGI